MRHTVLLVLIAVLAVSCSQEPVAPELPNSDQMLERSNHSSSNRPIVRLRIRSHDAEFNIGGTTVEGRMQATIHGLENGNARGHLFVLREHNRNMRLVITMRPDEMTSLLVDDGSSGEELSMEFEGSGRICEDGDCASLNLTLNIHIDADECLIWDITDSNGDSAADGTVDAADYAVWRRG